MSDSHPQAGPYQRAITDLLAAERELRAAAEQRVRALTKLLTDLGYRLDGSALEALQRKDPTVLHTWRPEDWQAFFEQVFRRGRGWIGAGECRSEQARLQREKDDLERQIGELQERATALRREIEQLARASAEKPLQVDSSASPAGSRKTFVGRSSTRKSAAGPPVEERPAPLARYAHADLVRALQEMDFHLPRPARFEGRVATEALRWKRQAMALYLMAAHALNVRVELQWILDTAEGNKPFSGAVKRVMETLVESDLLIGETLKITSPVETSLALLRLSDDGHALCRLFGWDAVESDWERLLRLRQGEQSPTHTLAVMAFAMHARLRGWQVEVAPDRGGTGAQPDLGIEKRGERRYVVVALGAQNGDGERLRQLAALQGHVALCVGDAADQARWVGECKLAGWRGFATNLEDFVRLPLPEITLETPLWSEVW